MKGSLRQHFPTQLALLRSVHPDFGRPKHHKPTIDHQAGRRTHRLKSCHWSTWRSCRSASGSGSPTPCCTPSHRRHRRRPRSCWWSMGCPKGCRPRRGGPSPSFRHRPDGRSARSSRAPAAPAASPAAPCSGPTSSTTTTGRPVFSSTFRPAGWCRRAARTSTPPGPRPATAPTSSASPSGSPRPTRGGGSTGTRCWTRPSRSRCSHSTRTAGKHPPTNGRRGPASAPPASTWHYSSRPRVPG